MQGALIIDKPEGWTSHDVVGKVRRLAGTRRVGHTGTLDPFATGVLVVCVGAATRLSQLLVGCDKEYLATIRLGWATDTQDGTGERVGEPAASELIPDDAALICRVLSEFSGEQDQLPPMYSAKKVGGRALYKHARAGREIERQPVRVRAEMRLADEHFEVNDQFARNEDGSVDVRVRVVCSAGTYVRTLAHDVGVRLGCGAHLATLRRTRVGRFSIDDAVTLEALEGHVAERIVPPADLVAELPVVRLDDAGEALARHGMPLPGVDVELGDGDPVALVDAGGALVGIARFDAETGLLKPRIILPGEPNPL